MVHIIPLTLGEIWSKRSNLASLLLVNISAEVAKVNAKALNIKSYQPRQKYCRGSAEAKCIFTSYHGILFAAAKNAVIRGLKYQ